MLTLSNLRPLEPSPRPTVFQAICPCQPSIHRAAGSDGDVRLRAAPPRRTSAGGILTEDTTLGLWTSFEPSAATRPAPQPRDNLSEVLQLHSSSVIGLRTAAVNKYRGNPSRAQLHPCRRRCPRRRRRFAAPTARQGFRVRSIAHATPAIVAHEQHVLERRTLQPAEPAAGERYSTPGSSGSLPGLQCARADTCPVRVRHLRSPIDAQRAHAETVGDDERVDRSERAHRQRQRHDEHRYRSCSRIRSSAAARIVGRQASGRIRCAHPSSQCAAPAHPGTRPAGIVVSVIAEPCGRARAEGSPRSRSKLLQ